MTGQLRTYHWIIEQSSETLLWLPVWMYRYRYGERFHRVVMNGQSGKISGDRPISPRKVGIAVLAVLIAALVLFTALHMHAAQAASATAANARSFATETARPTATVYPDQQTATADAFPTAIAQAPPPAPTASSNVRTFTDARGRFTLRYPAMWSATTGADPDVVTFVTPDGLHISVSLFPSVRTPLEQLRAIQANRPTTRAYANDSVQLAHLPGGAAATIRYRSVGATNPADMHDGVFWVIASGNGTLIQIKAYADSALTSGQQDAIAAMAQSVAFRS